MDFNNIQKKTTAKWENLVNSKDPVIYYGAASCGRAAGSLDSKKVIEETLKKLKIKAKLVEVGCIGPCCYEPLIYIQKPGSLPICYYNVTLDKAEKLVKDIFTKNKPRKDMALGVLGDKPIGKIPPIYDHSIFKNQVRLVLRNCGIIDPKDIDHYIAHDGYQAIKKVISMKPQEVIEEIKKSGLKGRGGAGFSTGMKWQFCRDAPGRPKYLICNADEGDPGAFMNRSLLEGDPHAVLEGMIIAAYAIGANQGYIYIRGEYPLAIERLNNAIKQMKNYNLIGDNILGSNFNFNIEIKTGAGAFVCGEETALMASIEGHRGMPRPRPPFPAQSGLWGKPTNINNVETMGSIANIIRMGGGEYSKLGSDTAKGTKTFSLVGKIKRPGLIEIPLGTKLKDIIYEVGGGIDNDKKFKAVQTGGPSGGCIPASKLDLTVDYQSLTAVGSIMGSGGLVVMDEDTCMVDIARFFLDFTQDESCGKCTPCRIGTKAMLDILTRITEGKGKEEDLDELARLCDTINKGSLCGLGQTAPNPVLTTVRHFKDEYLEHIRNKKCRASVCQELFLSPCQNTCPAETNVPGYMQLIKENRFVEAYKLNRESNPFSAVCGRICFHPCEDKCRRAQIDKSISIMALKRVVTDRAFEVKGNSIFKMKKLKDTGKKVVIIGGGPSGLTAAYFLKRLGHEVTVFEAHSKPGGMMVQGIPPYRLPREIIEREINSIEKMGVKIKLNTRVGKDISIKEIKEKHDAIYIAIGNYKEYALGIENEGANGVISGLQLLKETGQGKKVKVGKKIVVIGGGNSAIDTARTARRLGAEVTILYRRERKDMPAFEEEIDDALEEGIKLDVLVAPSEVLVKNGKVAGLKCTRMSLGSYDDSGRRRPVPIKNSEFDVDYDMIITAIGQSPDSAFLNDFSREILAKNGTIKVDKWTRSTSVKGVFAGGDVAGSGQTVIQAIADGKETSGEIDKYLTGKNRLEEIVGDYSYQMDLPDNQKSMTRFESRKRKPKERIIDFKEVCFGYNEKECLAEVERCLRCDIRDEDEAGGDS